MCITYPYKIKSIKNKKAIIDIGQIDLSLISKVKKNDWVLVSNNYAVSKISEQEAKDMLELFDKAREAGDKNAC